MNNELGSQQGNCATDIRYQLYDYFNGQFTYKLHPLFDPKNRKALKNCYIANIHMELGEFEHGRYTCSGYQTTRMVLRDLYDFLTMLGYAIPTESSLELYYEDDEFIPRNFKWNKQLGFYTKKRFTSTEILREILHVVHLLDPDVFTMTVELCNDDNEQIPYTYKHDSCDRIEALWFEFDNIHEDLGKQLPIMGKYHFKKLTNVFKRLTETGHVDISSAWLANYFVFTCTELRSIPLAQLLWTLMDETGQRTVFEGEFAPADLMKQCIDDDSMYNWLYDVFYAEFDNDKSVCESESIDDDLEVEEEIEKYPTWADWTPEDIGIGEWESQCPFTHQCSKSPRWMNDEYGYEFVYPSGTTFDEGWMSK